MHSTLTGYWTLLTSMPSASLSSDPGHSREVTEEGGAIWDVLLQEGSTEPKRSKPEAPAALEPGPYAPQRLADDAIPF